MEVFDTSYDLGSIVTKNIKSEYDQGFNKESINNYYIIINK